MRRKDYRLEGTQGKVNILEVGGGQLEISERVGKESIYIGSYMN